MQPILYNRHGRVEMYVPAKVTLGPAPEPVKAWPKWFIVLVDILGFAVLIAALGFLFNLIVLGVLL